MAATRIVQQVSIFLENKSGRLAEVCTTLGAHDINIRALCIADTSDFGILRLIVNDPAKAASVLQQAGFSVGQTSVIALQIPDRPGGLGGVLEKLEAVGINVEYMYAFFVRREGDAVVLFRVADDVLESTIRLLQEANVPILSAEDVYAL
ncbi:MAG: amino acid-binding protein [Armatimonadetes bacterium]|nr:amino acid-binding protein [Armatimonadota bacterium]